jgi:hypothetical protein
VFSFSIKGGIYFCPRCFKKPADEKGSVERLI